uniref:Uncharacterized protein n=1 Tax=Myotis myotis TaxID=51298 RepID=A0A7J7VHZ9_MYOMY|nr:hypothetical protein mMyoMyo1_008226 [Myotis myotis]
MQAAGEQRREAWASPTHPGGECVLQSGRRARQTLLQRCHQALPGQRGGKGKGDPRAPRGSHPLDWEGGADRNPASVQQIVPSPGGGGGGGGSLPEPFLPILTSTRDFQGPHQGPALDLHFVTAVYNTCVVGTPRGATLVSCKWGAENWGSQADSRGVLGPEGA